MTNTHFPIEVGPVARVMNAGWKCQEALKGLLAKEKLTIAQFSILLNIAKSKRNLRPGEIAKISRCTPTFAGRIIVDLCWKKLVERHHDGADSRARLVTLTPLGKKVVKQALVRIEAFQKSELDGLIAHLSVQVQGGTDHEVFQAG